MKRLIPALSALLIFSLFGLVFAGPLKVDVLDKAVQIDIDGRFTGSGSILNTPHGPRVLTAAHVVAGVVEANADATVEKKPVISITWRNGRRSTANVAHYGPSVEGGYDLALLKLKDADGVLGADLLPDKLSVEDGDDIWYCGRSGGPAFQLERNIVNTQDERYLYVGGSAWFGFSGSGVFARSEGKHYLVGVVVSAAESPERNPKTATRCEKPVKQFLASYKGE